jgi:hypothetical protein
VPIRSDRLKFGDLNDLMFFQRNPGSSNLGLTCVHEFIPQLSSSSYGSVTLNIPYLALYRLSGLLGKRWIFNRRLMAKPGSIPFFIVRLRRLIAFALKTPHVS